MKYRIQISVVMPCHNSGAYICHAMDSILQQSFTNFEFFIINDGSTDDTHEKILSYSDHRIKYIRLVKNKGNYYARNLGMRASSGKYICVMDSDDIACLNRLAVQHSYLEKNKKIGAIGGQAIWMDEAGELSKSVSRCPVCSAAQLKVLFLQNNFVIHPSLFLRSYLLKKNNLSYDEHYHISSDYDFVARSLAIFPVKNIKEPVIKYRIHNSQISSKQRTQQTAFADKIRLKLLSALSEKFNNDDITLFQKLMKGILLSGNEELTRLMTCLNRILELNYQKKIYQQHLLYNFFAYLISEARVKLEKIKIDTM